MDHLDLDILGERVAGPNFLEAVDPLQVHGDHAAVGLPRLREAQQASRYPSFRLIMEAEATELLRSGDRITGGPRTDADGLARDPRRPRGRRRWSSLDGDPRSARTCRARTSAHRSTSCGCAFLAWPADGEQVLGIVGQDKFLVMLNRGDYWQVRVPDREGRPRAVAAARTSGVPRRSAHARPVSWRPSRWPGHLERHQAADRRPRSAEALVDTGPPLYRRRRAR